MYLKHKADNDLELLNSKIILTYKQRHCLKTTTCVAIALKYEITSSNSNNFLIEAMINFSRLYDTKDQDDSEEIRAR